MSTPAKWGSEFPVNTITTSDQIDPAMTALADGRFLVTWTDHSQTLGAASKWDVRGQIFNADGSKAGAEFLVNTTTFHDQYQPAVAALSNGGFVVTWEDYSGGNIGRVRAQVFNADGSKSGAELYVDPGMPQEQADQACVTVLSGDRFVVTWQDHFGHGIWAQMFDAGGTKLGAEFQVNNVADTGTQWNPAIATLHDGGFIATWDQQDGNNDVTHLQIFNNAGGKVGTEFVVQGVSSGTEELPTVTTLANGSYVVAWNELVNGHHENRAQIVQPNGVLVGTPFTINTDQAGESYHSMIAGLPDGRFVATWEHDGANGEADVHAQLFNADGSKSGGEFVVNTGTGGWQAEPVIAALADGRVAVTWKDADPTDSDKSGWGLEAQILDPRESGRTITGTGLNDDLVGTGFKDTIKGGGGSDHLQGGDGDDLLIGGAGADTLSGGIGIDTADYNGSPAAVTINLVTNVNTGGDAQGDILYSIETVVGSNFDDNLTGNGLANTFQGGGGNDTINGLGGDDTAVFSHKFNDYTVEDFGAKIVVIGPEGQDTLTSIEHLQFADTTITPVNDGNPLFDTLYYLSRNADVFQAGVDPLQHFNQSGWHEGRDPNPFFSVSGYLGANPDVKAAGVNPLDHYDQTGWKQGRDPGPYFDTKLYLIHNPDVAAAGVDPLAHYLANGEAEGRQAYQAIGDNIVNGFDAEYYLFHNPDVAAAGVDPYQHYMQSGWHEGRNPNAYFDTAGYLAHYQDVAAAGVNPLLHYEQSGWMEGRDPSTAFDTLGYLASNPDVAAAQVNPLDHYLQSGIYEGRTFTNDFVFH